MENTLPTPVLQSEINECGLACIAMLAETQGVRAPLTELRERYPASQHGTSLATLCAILGELALPAYPVAFEHRHQIGVDRIMVESDYPHPDTSWPDTQRVLGEQFADFSQDDVEQMTYRNALELYRHPMPDVPWWSPAPSLLPR